MPTAKTAVKGSGIRPSRDVLPRYLQGALYTTRSMRRQKASSGGSGKRGKKKISVIPGSVPTDSKGWVI